MKTRKRLSLPLEFYLGTALGFLLASLMLNASYGWMFGFYPIPVLVMAALGWAAGVIRRQIRKETAILKQAPGYRFRVFFLLALLLCIFGPYLTMKGYYWVAATALPVPPGWTRVEVQTTVLGMDNGAGYRVRLEGHAEAEALQFYRDYFEKRGWSDESDRWIMSAGKHNAFTYGRPGDSARICFGVLNWGFDRVKQREYPIEYQPGQKRIVYVSLLK